jgi:hypothetical protein
MLKKNPRVVDFIGICLEELTRSQPFRDLVYSRKPDTALLLVCLLAGDRRIPEDNKNQPCRIIEPLQLLEVGEYRHCQRRR